jgi:hypothetical protein
MYNMPWGNLYNKLDGEFEALPESGCCVCFALEHFLCGGQKIFGLEQESDGFTCETHESMLRWIMASYYEWVDKMTEFYGFRYGYDTAGVKLRALQYGLATLDILDYKHRPSKTYEIILQKSPLSADITFEEMKMDASRIDLRLATMWKDKCINEHGSKCQELDESALIIPDWLIDTEENCIVSGKSVMEFVALNYRWGTSIGSEIDFKKLSELRKPGGLSNFIAEIPIIRDATQVVRSVNERYL